MRIIYYQNNISIQLMERENSYDVDNGWGEYEESSYQSPSLDKNFSSASYGGTKGG